MTESRLQNLSRLVEVGFEGFGVEIVFTTASGDDGANAISTRDRLLVKFGLPRGV